MFDSFSFFSVGEITQDEIRQLYSKSWDFSGVGWRRKKEKGLFLRR
jgi:hypothetical protein